MASSWMNVLRMVFCNPMGKQQKEALEIKARDAELLQLEQFVNQKETEIADRVDAERKEAVSYKNEGKMEKAKRTIRRAKGTEATLAKISAFHDGIRERRDFVSNADLQRNIANVYQKTQTTMSKIFKSGSDGLYEQVSGAVDGFAEMKDLSQEFSDLLAEGNTTVDLDDEALMDELDRACDAYSEEPTAQRQTRAPRHGLAPAHRTGAGSGHAVPPRSMGTSSVPFSATATPSPWATQFNSASVASPTPLNMVARDSAATTVLPASNTGKRPPSAPSGAPMISLPDPPTTAAKAKSATPQIESVAH
jgi:hypothetical protein